MCWRHQFLGGQRGHLRYNENFIELVVGPGVCFCWTNVSTLLGYQLAWRRSRSVTRFRRPTRKRPVCLCLHILVSCGRHISTWASPGLFIGGEGGGETGGPKAESGGRVLGEGQKPPPYHLGGLGSAVISASGVRGGVPTTLRFSTIFSTQDGLSWDYKAIGVQDPVPALAYAPVSQGDIISCRRTLIMSTGR